MMLEREERRKMEAAKDVAELGFQAEREIRREAELKLKKEMEAVREREKVRYRVDFVIMFRKS